MNRLFFILRQRSLLDLKLAHHFRQFLDFDLFVKNTFVSTIQLSMFAPLSTHSAVSGFVSSGALTKRLSVVSRSLYLKNNFKMKRTKKRCGGDLLSHKAALAVSSALRGLTAVFGMGTGVSLSLIPPQNLLGSKP
jgi:uncharacterized paraquat-inducible protein A